MFPINYIHFFSARQLIKYIMTYTCSQSHIVSSKTYTHGQLLHSPTYPTVFANLPH